MNEKRRIIMNNVVFTYQRTKEDVLDQQIWQTYRRSTLVMLLTFMFPAVGIYFLVNAIINGTDPLMYVFIAYLVFYPVVNYFLIQMRVNRFFNNPNNVFDVTTYDYASEGINISGDKGEFLLEWERITKVYNTKKYIYIYVDRRSSIIINKSVLKEQQIEFILKLLKDSTLPRVCKY